MIRDFLLASTVLGIGDTAEPEGKKRLHKCLSMFSLLRAGTDKKDVKDVKGLMWFIYSLHDLWSLLLR